MKTILASAYAVNPYKGSEDAMGWNFVNQIAKNQKVIAITRENNRESIEKYMLENPAPEHDNIRFLYFDLPHWARFWKKGARGAMLYYYLWQLFLPRFVKSQNLSFDLVHNVNFHNDWTPSMLWTLKKPMLWGPVGHHPKIPRNFLLDQYGISPFVKDRLIWGVKNYFWKIDPILNKTRKKTTLIWGMNSSVPEVLGKDQQNMIIYPSVSSEYVKSVQKKEDNGFTVLSVGRFVPLKGFDVTIRSFAKFYHTLDGDQKKEARLILVGKGPLKAYIEKLIIEKNIAEAVTIINWVDRERLAEIYARSSAFLFPSHEGAGMVVSEALSYSLPVVCFNNNGPGEYINAECGLKVNYGEYERVTDEFSTHLKTLFANKAYRMKLSVGARQQFEKYFDWHVKGRLLTRIYDALTQPSTKNEVLQIQGIN